MSKHNEPTNEQWAACPNNPGLPRDDDEPDMITEMSLQIFLAYAKDAKNWNGVPLVGGNVGGGKAERGNLTQLKRAGLITTTFDEGETWINFTEAGKVYAAQHGVEI